MDEVERRSHRSKNGLGDSASLGRAHGDATNDGSERHSRSDHRYLKRDNIIVYDSNDISQRSTFKLGPTGSKNLD